MGADRTIGGSVMLGVMANSRSRGGFVAEAVVFDGTNDYLNESMVGLVLADSKVCIISFWVRPVLGGNMYILSSKNTGTNVVGAEIWLDNSGKLFYVGRQGGGATMIAMESTNTLSANVWHHVLLSQNNGGPSLSTIYVDDVNVTNITTGALNGKVEYNGHEFSLGARWDLSLRYQGDIAECYVNTSTWQDGTIEANRRNFISSAGAPVDLGSDGSTPTGAQPGIYITGDASVWNAGTNKGSSIDFVMTGAVTDSTNEPVVLP